jgi:hypothetical protein
LRIGSDIYRVVQQQLQNLFYNFCKGSVAVTLYAKNSTHVVRSERQVKVVTMLNVRYLVFYGHTLEDAPCCKARSQRRDA